MAETLLALSRPRRDSQPPLLLSLKNDPFLGSVFLCLLLIGGDRIAIRPGGLTLRVVFPLLLASCSFLYLQHGRAIALSKPITALFLLWAIAGGLSAFGSYDQTKSIGYTIWILFDCFAIIGLCYNFAKNYDPDRVLSVWFLAFRVHAVLIFLDILRGIITHRLERPYLWFYEPSYLAVFMSAYFGSSLNIFLSKGRPYLLDFVLSTISILVITSATGIFSLLFAVILNVAVARQRLKLMLGSAVLGAIFLGCLILFFQKTAYYQLIVGFLFSGKMDVWQLILERGGNRVVRIMVGWQAFLHHPWLGIGVGADSTYMDVNPYPDAAWQYIHSWTDLDMGQPFCNVFVAVLGTQGIIGFVPFAGILVYSLVALIKQLRHGGSPYAVALLMGFLCTLLALQLDGTPQRYYLWTSLGLAFGVIANRRASTALLRKVAPFD